MYTSHVGTFGPSKRFHVHALILIAMMLSLSCAERENPEARSSVAGKDTVESDVGRNGNPRPLPGKPLDEMIKAERAAYIAQLKKAGYFDCCINPSCTMCLFDEKESCSCRESVQADDPVCGECYKGWRKGNGNVAGIVVSDIRRK